MNTLQKYKRSIVMCMVILSAYFSMSLWLLPYSSAVKAVTYRYGSSGTVVTRIQTRLKSWGYYTGSVDGRYGYLTYLAVKKFQGKVGLNPDGIAGNSTLSALGLPTGTTTTATQKYSSNSQDLLLLSRLINGEARGEPYAGQVAVGAVVLNRTRDPRFPSTVAGVIYQPGAFTAIVDGQIHATIVQSSKNAARDALNGWDPSGGAVYYYNPAKTTNKWIWSRPVITVIGKHKFCR